LRSSHSHAILLPAQVKKRDRGDSEKGDVVWGQVMKRGGEKNTGERGPRLCESLAQVMQYGRGKFKFPCSENFWGRIRRRIKKRMAFWGKR